MKALLEDATLSSPHTPPIIAPQGEGEALLTAIAALRAAGHIVAIDLGEGVDMGHAQRLVLEGSEWVVVEEAP